MITAVLQQISFLSLYANSKLAWNKCLPIKKIICFCTSPYFCHNTRMRAAIRHTRARQRVKRWQTMRGSRNENLSKLEMIRQLWRRITAPRHVHLWVARRDARKCANVEHARAQVCCEALTQANIHGLKMITTGWEGLQEHNPFQGWLQSN